MNKTKGFLLASLAVLGGTTGLTSYAAAEEINIILCGDVVTPVYTKLFEEWTAANPDFPVAAELVGWGQCQDKVTTLAVAGTPVDIAYVGSRTLKQFAQNDLIVPV
ncbi:MAG: extracellular solute-binding protein, partial [Proteobacteria bacterium]